MITIDSKFDGGAIEVISAEEFDNIQLAITKDNQNCTRQWFYFSVDTGYGVLQTIRLVNASQVTFSEAFNGYQAFASYDNQQWFRIDTQFQKGELILTLNAEQPKVFYAYFVPYPMSREIALLDKIKINPAVNVEVLGKTSQGRNINLLRIGSVSSTAKKMWFIARQHPGETMAQWMAEGVINRFIQFFSVRNVGDNNVCVYIVANMNPDGSAIGNHRTNANGINLNRHWGTPDPKLCPEVHLVKQAMIKYGVDMFFDLHGDETLPHNFIISEGNNNVITEVKSELAICNEHFQTKYDYDNNMGCGGTSCCGSESSCGKQLATQFVQKQFGVPSALLEASFKALAQDGSIVKWDNLTAVRLGEDLAMTLYDKIGCNK
ncbi:M14-type cytosolic carboxypeptidase [Shewanella zhangzhouensis]|uniref:M14-type cytosolic carboxypeptidase n=1 Tax=Shewanella zhangzhouensis TaxID=2864213 RepID=UPI001C65B51D|nr:M14-type cytosolic carboxypeptidase [Shewanella zhangzhouensis]QYK05855.1 hypothetical protein K0H63_03160 [Shewanella zhangzhouensis]